MPKPDNYITIVTSHDGDVLVCLDDLLVARHTTTWTGGATRYESALILSYRTTQVVIPMERTCGHVAVKAITAALQVTEAGDEDSSPASERPTGSNDYIHDMNKR